MERRLLEPICREGRLPSLGTAAEYGAMLKDAGFAPGAAYDLSARVRRTWSICIRRILAGLLTRPHYARYLLDARNHDRVFFLTLPRLWLAYATGALQYGLFTGRK
jgi:tocopherol O-methyltransferase